MKRPKTHDEFFALAGAVLNYFPGYAISSMNPDVCLDLRETHKDGRYTCVDTIRLSITAAICLVTSMKPERMLREDM